MREREIPHLESGIRPSLVSFPPLAAGKEVPDPRPASVPRWFLLLETLCDGARKSITFLTGLFRLSRQIEIWPVCCRVTHTDTHTHQQQQLCLSAGADYRDGSVFGSDPHCQDPFPQSYAGPGGGREEAACLSSIPKPASYCRSSITCFTRYSGLVCVLYCSCLCVLMFKRKSLFCFQTSVFNGGNSETGQEER